MENTLSAFRERCSSFEGIINPTEASYFYEWDPIQVEEGATRVVPHIRDNIRAIDCGLILLGLRPRGLQNQAVELECLLDESSFRLNAGAEG